MPPARRAGARRPGQRVTGSDVVTLETPLRSLLETRDANAFAKQRGVETVGDLMAFWPRRYKNREADLGSATVGDYLVAVADVKEAHVIRNRTKPGSRFQAVISDGHTDLQLTWFKTYAAKDLQPGVRALFAGQVGEFNHALQLTHPTYQVLGAGEQLDDNPPLIPFYLPVGKIPPWGVTRLVKVVLEMLGPVEDPLPEMLRRRHGLVDRTTALRGVHRPDSPADVEAGQHRLRFDEALVLQLALAQRRARQAQERTTARRAREGGLLEAFDARLPFELTGEQRAVGDVVAAELGGEVPMHRLLQGEVGSGKTVVALRAMLAAVDAGGQAALLAPTEVLAGQHHRTVMTLLGDLAEGGLLGGSEIGTRVTLLTGSMTTAQRKRALNDIVTGDAGIVIGTHALIQEHVEFYDLALVVVDEQHRFGVEQRDALRGKGSTPPHVLVMTATPIPRTVAMTVFGDMETSTLRELPAGRAGVTTHVVPELKPGWMTRVWAKVADEVRAGRQAYVVCPRIGEDLAEEGLDLLTDPEADEEGDALFEPPDAGIQRPMASVLATHAELLAEPALQGLRVEILHGRMDPEAKDAIMLAFAAREIDVLVATTVIEVGVDVPNATVMVVRDAERFGVSQLHQLRGRIGRGAHPGIAFLVSATTSEVSGARLEAVARTTDGFELSRLDLALRREGDVLGAAQHGRRSHLQFLRILEHEDVIEAARAEASAIIAADPELEQHPGLAAEVEAHLDEERAAYLERG